MAKAKEAAALAVLDLPVGFGNVSIGDETARIGIRVERKFLSLKKADENLCGRRLWGKIVARSSGQAEQDSIPGMDGQDSEVQATFDVKGFGVSKKSVSFGLTFALESVDVQTLSLFAKRSGKLVVTGVEDMPVKAQAAPVPHEDEE
jgi:hypothetical protein